MAHDTDGPLVYCLLCGAQHVQWDSTGMYGKCLAVAEDAEDQYLGVVSRLEALGAEVNTHA